MIYGPPDTNRHPYTTTHRGPKPAQRAQGVKSARTPGVMGGSHGKVSSLHAQAAADMP